MPDQKTFPDAGEQQLINYVRLATCKNVWYYRDRCGVSRGPATLPVLKEAWVHGVVDENTLVWGHGLIDFLPIKNIRTLVPQIRTPEGALLHPGCAGALPARSSPSAGQRAARRAGRRLGRAALRPQPAAARGFLPSTPSSWLGGWWRHVQPARAEVSPPCPQCARRRGLRRPLRSSPRWSRSARSAPSCGPPRLAKWTPCTERCHCAALRFCPRAVLFPGYGHQRRHRY